MILNFSLDKIWMNSLYEFFYFVNMSRLLSCYAFLIFIFYPCFHQICNNISLPSSQTHIRHWNVLSAVNNVPLIPLMAWEKYFEGVILHYYEIIEEWLPDWSISNSFTLFNSVYLIEKLRGKNTLTNDIYFFPLAF